ncbi:transposable element Tcb2 transposase [Trichonephila clavipes]|nr:transposable element Tcb2 transposase [Trichonephila clavipes]
MFSLSSDCRRQLIWRESGTAYRPENIQEKDRYPTCSIMVWAGIMINGRMSLHWVANGTMTGQRYIDEVLLPHVRLFRGAVGDKFVFMDDNATCHRTIAVQDCLDSDGIQRLVWPARSPDLNPIENVWDALGRQVAGRNYPPTNKNTLIRALTEEWDKLPQELLDNVVQKFDCYKEMKSIPFNTRISLGSFNPPSNDDSNPYTPYPYHIKQCGFRPKCSTVHQLLRVTELIHSGFGKHEATGILFLDIAKAFDKIWHDGLLIKLIRLDFPPP